ncbi:pimeloyl-ACP methyl ester carboxylesterase [Amycolatopsis bartoniae]|uniref:Esterase n=1 Tax=Amycolatopsis bartoniae TaxID=941986 RepID=A0A8H9ITF8_9PSEU|nr:alpha/beta fold hydrolase [Amycolatopsis bartoniae]MBB2939758.1 pimeloyl-ACP methyl ester carboxylesterase [Amycolatopsis bartoniae]TVT08345.1 alpha/beta fold hydrolase [Amycolatopsis bartoniae]GHF36019.1 esterase [Amycolatopsis bartoniae]
MTEHNRMPGFALQHGGFHGSWCWERVVPLLEAPAVAIDLPGREGDPATLRGITSAEWTRGALGQINTLPTDRVVLVAHSLGGVTALNAAKVLGDRLAHLILVSALVPAEGQTPAELIARGAHRDSLLDETGQFGVPPIEAVRTLLANDVPDEAEALYARLRREPMGPISEPFTHDGLPAVPTTYVRLTRDNAVPPAMQEQMIANLPHESAVTEIDAGHNVMMSRPGQLADLLNLVAASGGNRATPTHRG